MSTDERYAKAAKKIEGRKKGGWAHHVVRVAIIRGKTLVFDNLKFNRLICVWWKTENVHFWFEADRCRVLSWIHNYKFSFRRTITGTKHNGKMEIEDLSPIETQRRPASIEFHSSMFNVEFIMSEVFSVEILGTFHNVIYFWWQIKNSFQLFSRVHKYLF